MPSLHSQLMQDVAAPALFGVHGEDATTICWVVPLGRSAFVVTRSVIGPLTSQQELDPQTGELLLRERREWRVERKQLEAGGVVQTETDLRAKLPDGEWLVDPSSGSWGSAIVVLNLVRQALTRPREMRRG